MFARISAFVIWSLVAATAVFWLLRLTATSPQAPAYAAAVGKSTVVRGDLNRLFGAPPVVVAAIEAQPAAPSRFKLVGVMAPRSKEAQSIAGNGLALIAVDGKAPKAFAVGASVESGLVLQSVGLRTASIGPAQGARSMLLELPVIAPAATGVLPPSGYVGSPAISGVPALPQGYVSGPVPSTNGSSMDAPIPNGGAPFPAPNSTNASMGGGLQPGIAATQGAPLPSPDSRGRSPAPTAAAVSPSSGLTGVPATPIGVPSSTTNLPPGIVPSPSGRLPANANARSQ